ncbi:MAG: bifunctional [glutamate--ammonia ligase]-adenylyl-L-tyrosine phosphorylase/[glutamate--ammonia-ligase] adenylyltransferase [Proteobacteria bacterium]|nr:bifunctional [glutamate--ammonia ligase]-adenylyl-L-tyrosine phosphorylase/[glutamate--ammonia-ligase] adenylyltransferase [Pseudomonadota bacterium]
MSADLASYSRYVQRVRRLGLTNPPALGTGTPSAAQIDATIAAHLAQGLPLGAALRRTRQAVLERLAVRDVDARASLAEITQAMSDLAEVTLERALAEAHALLQPRHGAPRNDQGQPIEMWIVGMGKLGARELNVSSDIDLIYIYEEEGETDGAVPLSAQEYFGRVAKHLYALMGDVTEDGFVFRMDLALRPHGASGPPVASLAMLEQYLLTQGREWERFAWLKSRVVAPRAAVTSGRALALAHLVTPFVYRKYLDYGVFEGLRRLHRKIGDEARRKATGRPERANDVKLGRGGIREIEFIVQLLQVARGGQFPEIRTRRTLEALARLARHGLMSPARADQLARAYTLLRQMEHRIQYLDDAHTHVLPTTEADLRWMAATLPGLHGAGDVLALLVAVREVVTTEFDALLEGGGQDDQHGLAIDQEELWERLPAGLQVRLRELALQPRVQALRDVSRLRLGAVVLAAGDAMARGQASEVAVLRLLDWLESLLRRDSYLAMLTERPDVLTRLLNLLGLARWPLRYMLRHPGVIDELADERQLHERFDRLAFETEMADRHAAWVRAGEADEAELLDTLRRAHHTEVFRTLVRDVEGKLTVEQVADDLSALADAMLATCVDWAWSHFKQRHRETPQLAVIAYGKLGGLELGYGSDLDVVFLYDDADEADPDQAQMAYTAFVRKLITWLTLQTAEGGLFEIDTALRPNGNSGLLVTSIAAFERYQQGRGANHAWTWEHQALTRARCACGSAALAARFEATRCAVLATAREAEPLRAEIMAMRAKVSAARPVKEGLFDVKHSLGGMMDAEFAVQYLVLAHAHHHPDLLANVGNIALMQRAQQQGLLPPGVGDAAANAYRELRRSQHRARLDEQLTQFDPTLFAPHRAAITALTQAVFG